jgi:hypothetical protein
MHIYCQECLIATADEVGQNGRERSTCETCVVEIKDTVHCGSAEELGLDNSLLPLKPSPFAAPSNNKTNKNKKFSKKGNLNYPLEEEEEDWISPVRHLMPDAKLMPYGHASEAGSAISLKQRS